MCKSNSKRKSQRQSRTAAAVLHNGTSKKSRETRRWQSSYSRYSPQNSHKKGAVTALIDVICPRKRLARLPESHAQIFIVCVVYNVGWLYFVVRVGSQVAPLTKCCSFVHLPMDHSEARRGVEAGFEWARVCGWETPVVGAVQTIAFVFHNMLLTMFTFPK